MELTSRVIERKKKTQKTLYFHIKAMKRNKDLAASLKAETFLLKKLVLIFTDATQTDRKLSFQITLWKN